MSQTEMDRVRADLATMKQAAGVGLPIGRSDVCLSLAWAAAGVPLAAWAAYTPTPPGQSTFGLLLVIPYLGWAVFTMLFAVTAPLLGQRYLGVFVGGWLILSGLSAAGIMGWQIHRSVDEHATD